MENNRLFKTNMRIQNIACVDSNSDKKTHNAPPKKPTKQTSPPKNIKIKNNPTSPFMHVWMDEHIMLW